MIRLLTTVILFFTALIFGVSYYLQPNDLSVCDIKPTSTINCQAVDAVVAISGGDTESRANWAIDLYKNGWSNTIVFSGAAQDKSGPSNAAVMKSLAITAGVPDSNIIIDEYSETTTQNAENTKTIFSDKNIKRVILVTSGYHQRRSSLEFNKQAGGDVVILNSPAQSDNDWSFWWWLTPRGWWLATTEIAKIIIFYVTSIWP